MLQHTDSTLSDTALYGFQNITANHGDNIAINGILIVFVSLILISLIIYIFNRIFSRLHHDDNQPFRPHSGTQNETDRITKPSEIPPDHLAAITTAVELYRRLHFEPLNSAVTFSKGETQPGWKVGFKYGQRFQLRKLQ